MMNRQSKWMCTLILFVLSVSLNVNLALAGGPSCTVTSVMPGSFTSSMEGSCYPTMACKSLKGIAIGSCGAGNVCCAFPRTCDAVSAQNHTYFTNPSYPAIYNGSTSCTLTIHKQKSPYRICQLRLDFIDFELNRPVNGNCNTDRFVVSGQNSNSMVPPLCGRNTGQHLYLDVDAAQGPFTIRITTSGNGHRRWNIQIIQIECGNPSRSPPNCLQYHTQQQGQIFSFNYEPPLLVSHSSASSSPIQTNTQMQTNSQQSASYASSMNGHQSMNQNLPQNEDMNQNNVMQINQQQQPLPDRDETGYLNGLDYTICFRKENGFCSQTYYVNASTTPFELLNVDNAGNPTFDQNFSGVGIQKCPHDYLLLNNIRFCGYQWRFAHRNQNVNTESSIVDTSSGPFFARFVTDYHLTGRGFKLNYQQNPCGTFLQSNSILPIG